MSYKDILPNIKTAPKMEEIVKAMFKIRNSQNGDLLLQLIGTKDK